MAAPAVMLLFLSNSTQLAAQTPAPAEIQNKYFITNVTKQDIEILLKDASPSMLRQLASDPALKKIQVKNIRELLAIGSQAVKDGLVTSDVAAELDNIRTETTATIYDQKIVGNKGKPLSTIPQGQVEAFYSQTANSAKFDQYLKGKIEQLKRSNPSMGDFKPSENDIREARDYFARINIYDAEANSKSADLDTAYHRMVNLKVRLQQTQYIAALYTRTVLQDKLKVTDDAYLDQYREMTRPQKEKATQVLLRARSGENFAALANEFTDDPGNKDAEGRPQGGIYTDITRGKMVAEFEQAALALEPGQISGLVETDYGFHILKLERKGMEKVDGKLVETYDVRHVLISTTIPDPDNPQGRQVPVKEMLRAKLEAEREKRLMGEILSTNPVEVAEDFDVPAVTDEQLRESQKARTNEPAAASTPVESTPIPAKIKKYLNLNYRGWKPAPSKKGCGPEVNEGFIHGDFDGDGKRDYAVKFTKGKKGYMLALLRRGSNYRAFVLHNASSEEVISSSLILWKKGELFEDGEVKFRLKRDAPAEYGCESDVGGVHYYRNGKFVNY